jgi:AAA domain
MIDPSRPAMRAEFSGQVKSVPDGDDIILCADDGFDELTDAPPKPWLIKNVIARGETSSWIAPPGKGKSALLTDIAVHLAGVFAIGRSVAVV